MTEDPISVLEDRLRVLEMKIFGQSGSVPEVSSPIVDSLVECQKVVSSTVSGREKMTSMVKRLDQLETVLDPMYEDSVLDSAAKLAFVFSMDRELEEVTRQLVRLNELSPCLESEQLRNLSQLMKQMNQLTNIAAEHKLHYEDFDDGVDDLITKYTEVINGVTSVFTALDSKVTELEIKAKPKKIIE